MTREHIEFVLSEYSADALAGKLLELFDEEAASYQHTINELNKALSENKGEWIYDKTIHNWRCSKCGQTPPPTGYVGMADFMATHFKFCNHCGADMRGERMTLRTKGEQRAYADGFENGVECVKQYLPAEDKKKADCFISAVRNAVEIEDIKATEN